MFDEEEDFFEDIAVAIESIAKTFIFILMIAIFFSLTGCSVAWQQFNR